MQDLYKQKTSDENRLRIIAISTLAFFAFIAAYFPAIRILVSKWATSEEYSHAFFVLPIICFMLWKEDVIQLKSDKKSSMLGLILVALSSALYTFALLTAVHTLILLSMYFTILGSVIFLGNAASIKRLATPLFLLLLLIPAPDQLITQLTFPLQMIVSQLSEQAILLFKIPLIRLGNIMEMPGRSFEVVGACSGLRSVITLMTLSLIIGYFMLKRRTSKLVLFMASFPIAIVINIVRIVAMIFIYHLWKVDFSSGKLHTYSGVVIFFLALSLLFAINNLLEIWEEKKSYK